MGYAFAMPLTFLVLLAGCAPYRPAPLTHRAIQQALAVPSSQEIRIQASAINHPILNPVPFDESDGLSPDEAAILAVIENPLLRAVRDAKGLAAAQVIQAGILPNPQVSYSFETPIGGNTHGKVNAFGLGLDWDVTSLVAQGACLKAARSHAASVDLEVAWKEWQVAEAAKLHVYRLLIAERQLAVTRAAMRVCEHAYEAARRGVAIGVETVQRLSSAKRSLQKAQADVLQAESKANMERLELKRVLGLPSKVAMRIEEGTPLILANDIPTLQELVMGIEKRRLDLLALRYGYESQEARLRAAIRSQFPKISLGLTRARDTDAVQTIGVGIDVLIPVLDRNQGRIAIEQATRKQLFDEYVSRLFEARADIAQILEKLRSTKRQIENADKSVQDQRELAERYRKAADQGRADILDYYQTMIQLYAQELDRLTLQRRLSDLAIGLEIASGQYIFTGSRQKSEQTR